MNAAVHREETACRSCGGARLRPVLDLGRTPLADRLLRREQLGEDEPTAPLTLVFCDDCSLVQITQTVEPAILFGSDYPYFSSVSAALGAHFALSAERLMDSLSLGHDSLVVEAASNDGYLLQHFARRGIPVLGIDPAAAPVAAAVAKGIPTLNTFFGRELAESLREEHPAGADLFLANNVLAHVSDLNGFVAGIARLLKADGLAVIEVPYVRDLVEHREFDTIYHQHLCYFSVTSLHALFERHGLFLGRVERTTVHGGSLRLFVRPTAEVEPSVAELLAEERALGVDRFEHYRGFARDVRQLKDALCALLESIRHEGKSIAGYGAAAKACTLLSYCGIGAATLDFIADRNAFKVGRYMGGSHIPVVSCDHVVEAMPDYLLILAWNFAEEIMREQHEYRARGGRFIVPVPEPVVL